MSEDQNILRNQGALILIAEELQRDIDAQDKRIKIVNENQDSLNKRMEAFWEMLKGVRGKE